MEGDFENNFFFQSSYFVFIFEDDVLEGEYVLPLSDSSGKRLQILKNLL